jgi:uncharacterized RDD family membrane protein YckC
MTRRVGPASEVIAPAGIVTRMLAAIIDFVVVLGLTGGVFGAVAAGLFLISPASFSWPRDLPFDTSVLGLAIAVVYLTVGWAITGQTVGGAVFGVRVVALGRRRLGWLRSGLRAVLCVFVPLGLLWSAVSVNRRSLQDLLVRSAVLYDGHGDPATARATPR